MKSLTGMLPLFLAVLMIAISIPMALRKVPPNEIYGFRTPKTLSNARIWYQANRLAGINLIVAGLLTLAIWGGVLCFFGPAKAGFISFPSFFVLLMGALCVSLLQLRKM